MGFGGISIWQLLIIFAIILLIFGGKRLRNLGGDVGTAIKGFKNAMQETKPDESENQLEHPQSSELTGEKTRQKSPVESTNKPSNE